MTKEQKLAIVPLIAPKDFHFDLDEVPDYLLKTDERSWDMEEVLGGYDNGIHDATVIDSETLSDNYLDIGDWTEEDIAKELNDWAEGYISDFKASGYEVTTDGYPAKGDWEIYIGDMKKEYKDFGNGII